MTKPTRSWLYTPATHPDRIAKAIAGDSDAVVVDLEDAVAPAAKDQARDNLGRIFETQPTKPVWVRINPIDGPWGEDDLAALSGFPIGGVRVPKAESPKTVAAIADAIGAPVGLIIETALGVERAFDLAASHPSVISVSLGEADLRADLRVRGAAALGWARSRLVNAARAASLLNPPMSVYTNVRDLAGLRSSSEAGLEQGFFGRSVVHPAQIATVNEVFTPRPEEIDEAVRLIDLLAAAEHNGQGAWLADSGEFIDLATVQQARWLVEFNTAHSTD